METQTATSASLTADLAGQGYTVEETHISRVFLRGNKAFKIKKPVKLGYLDYGSLEKRRVACEREVDLNSRLSPDIYLGVVPVTLGPDGLHRFGGDGVPIDWAVEMLRLPEGQRGEARLEAGTLTSSHLASLASRLADFHALGEVGVRIARFGDARAVRRIVKENFAQSRDVLRKVLSSEEAFRLESGYVGFISVHGDIFRERMKGGRIRDGHGDLRLDQIYFDDSGKAIVLDCIEFNDRFRYGDVAADIAFLAMDLTVRGRGDLAEDFLAEYARVSGDYGFYALVDFYEGLRACVRGKIAGYGILEEGAPQEKREKRFAEAGKLFRFALGKLEPPASPGPLVLFGGGMGTGKSTLASALGRLIHAPVLDSDRTRKALAGLEPLTSRTEDLWQGLYSPGSTDAVYRELARLAGIILATGRPVILDASFRSRAHREAMRRLAAESGHPFHFFECRAAQGLVEERLRKRALGPSISDGREAIAGPFLETWEPLDVQEAADGKVVNTEAPLQQCLHDILDRIGMNTGVPA